MSAERVQLWHGPDVAEAAAAYTRAIEAGFSELRARIFGSFASWRDCWTLQSTLARFHKCSVRTVQRTAHEAREIGFLRCAFSKPGERPPGSPGPMPFKWCHRWIPGRGLAGAALQKAVDKARAAWVITTAAISRTKDPLCARPKPTNPPKTAEEIDAELERIERARDSRVIPPAPKRRMSADEIDEMLERIERPPDK